jgi:PAS domain S-box-containing protein
MAAPLPTDELRRLQALRDLRVLDTPDEPAFDELVQLAAHVCRAPAAVLTLVDESRQWFKARVGIGLRETHRDASFCAHTILGDGVLVVADATHDERFADNPLVTGEPGIRFYAGAPLLDRAGNALGSLAAIDFVPRSVEPVQTDLLVKLARQASAQLELRQLLDQQRLVAQEAVESEMRAARRRAAAEIAQIFSLSGDLIGITGTNGHFRQVNPAFERVLGFPAADLIGLAFTELIHPDDQPAAREELQRLVTAESSRSFSNRVRTRTGHWRWIEWNAVRAPDSETVYAVGRDLTDHRRLQQQRDSERDVLEALAQGMPLAEALHQLLQAVERDFPHVIASILLMTPDGQRLRHLAAPSLPQEACRAIDGLPVAAGSGACGTAAYTGQLTVVEDTSTDPSWTDFRELARVFSLHACWSMPILSSIGRVLGTFALYRRHRGGPGEEELAVIRRGAHLAGLAIERHQLFQTLLQNEHRLRTLVEEARDAVVQLTPELRIEGLNAAFETITGWPRDRWLGQPFVDVVHEAERNRANEVFGRVLRGEKVPPFELRLQQPNGNRLTLEFSATPDYSAGTMGGLMAIGRDLTARKELEEQLQQAQRMESVGQLAGGVAHDFNNILAVILMQASLIESLEHPPPSIAEGLQQIRMAAERAAGLTRQLLTFSRRQHMELRDVDLSQVVDDLGKMLRRILGEDIELRTSSAGKLPLVHADVGMIEQVIMNLVVNARDAMPRGGLLTISTAVEVSPKQAGGLPFQSLNQRAVVLTVTDTGSGIPAEIVPRIFEPFFTTKEVGKGTGLGLATVYGIVRQHGGAVDVDSEVGRGTRFRVLLPAVEGPAAAADRTAPVAELRGGDETVLVVEDEAVVRALVRLVLEQKGYRVIEAVSGATAVALWEQGLSFDLLLTDMIMPGGVSGQELAQLILARRPDLPVIYTSGYSGDAVAQGFLLTEGKDFLQKPFGPIKLLTTVRAALDAANTPS